MKLKRRFLREVGMGVVEFQHKTHSNYELVSWLMESGCCGQTGTNRQVAQYTLFSHIKNPIKRFQVLQFCLRLRLTFKRKFDKARQLLNEMLQAGFEFSFQYGISPFVVTL
ncbi:uncharacterized protein LOC128127968 [Lactuca sativa]|uniref:uncharacterized protein LOC128127968 n=1 Tax=Lactuca sativa TaxID=4236 RepID=UPI0022AF9169|nr:uncharacterized protein LOC128127968 [Lactuca sativa]